MKPERRHRVECSHNALTARENAARRKDVGTPWERCSVMIHLGQVRGTVWEEKKGHHEKITKHKTS